MADMFKVYDIKSRSSEVMDFSQVCTTYPDANLLLLKENSISIVSIYNSGEKIAVVNRIREDK